MVDADHAKLRPTQARGRMLGYEPAPRLFLSPVADAVYSPR